MFLLLFTQSTCAVCFGSMAGKALLAQLDQSFAVQNFFPIQKLCPLLRRCTLEYYLEVAEPLS